MAQTEGEREGEERDRGKEGQEKGKGQEDRR